MNSNQYGFLGSSSGPRQQDPLSSRLFILVMEALSRKMDKAVLGGFLKAFNAAIEGERVRIVLVFHLLFVYDTLASCDADMNQLII